MPQELLDLIARIAELTATELADLDAALVAWFAEANAAEDRRDHIDDFRAARDARTAIAERSDALAAEDAAIESELADLAAAFTAQEEAPEGEPGDDGDEQEEEPEPEEEAAAEPEPVAAAAPPAAPPAVAPISEAARRVPASVRPRPAARPAANRAVALSAGVAGIGVGTELPTAEGERLAAIGGIVQNMARAFAGTNGSGEKIAAARILADWPEERRLDGTIADLDKMRAVRDGYVPTGPAGSSLVAAGGICAPAMPYYGMAQISDDERPVRAALTGFQATRGGITFIPPNQIDDYDTATDEWTTTDDLAVTDNSATWKPVQTITCGTAQTVTLRAVTAILQFGNWNDRTHPESVAADVANTMANHARLAESLLLDDVKAGSTKVTWGGHTGGPVGVARDMLVVIGQAAAGYRNRNRMNPATTLVWLAPAWLRDAMQADFALAAPGDMTFDEALAEINGYLALRGVEPNWYLDSPSSGPSQYFGAQSAGALNNFPGYAQWALFHQGAWLFLDGGELDLGVVRDSTLNRQNSFQMFSETFEKAAGVGVDSIWGTSIVSVAGGFGAGEDLGS